MKIAAVVPVKNLSSAKERLQPVLTPALRRALMLAMLRDVLEVASAHLPVIVATSDPEAAAIAQRFGAQVSREDAAVSHTAAVAAAARVLARDGSAMLTLPADIPLLACEDIARVIDTDSPFAIVPAADGLGSNAVLCRPATLVPLSFGGASCARNSAAARALGIEPRLLALPRIALDIDTAEDLARFRAIPSNTRARALLDAALAPELHS